MQAETPNRELLARMMPLARAFERLGLTVSASAIVWLLDPRNCEQTTTQRHVRAAEYHLRRYLRGEDDLDLQRAIASLIAAATPGG